MMPLTILTCVGNGSIDNVLFLCRFRMMVVGLRLRRSAYWWRWALKPLLHCCIYGTRLLHQAPANSGPFPGFMLVAVMLAPTDCISVLHAL
jgi:hypothetical protein